MYTGRYRAVRESGNAIVVITEITKLYVTTRRPRFVAQKSLRARPRRVAALTPRK
jgi:hypothetical protein